MFRILIIIVFILPALSFGAIRGGNKSSASVTPSKYDIRSARSIRTTLKSLSKNQIKRKQVTVLNRNIKRSRGFKHLYPITKNLVGIPTIKKNLHKFYKFCPIKKNLIGNDIGTFIDRKIDQHCAKKFLSIFLKKKLPKRFSGKNLAYLRQKLPYYLENDSAQLIRYLEKINHKPTLLYKQFSTEISNSYISNNYFPNPDIIGLISISDQFLLFLEQVGINDLETQRYLTGEFKRLRTALKKSLNREDFEAAKTLVGHLLSFHSQNAQYLPRTISWKTFLTAGKKFLQGNNYNEGMQALHYASRIAPQREKDKIVFFLLWGNHTKGRFKDSMKILHEFNLIERFAHLDTRLKYWVSDTLLRTGEDHLAKHFLKKIVVDDPMSFYAIISLRELSQRYELTANSTFFNSIRTPASINIPPTAKFSSNYRLSLIRLSSWLQIGNDVQSRREIGSIFSNNTDAYLPNLNSVTAECNSLCITARHLSSFLTKKGEYLHAFRLINRTISDGTIDWNIVKQLFPLKYLKSIKKHSQDIDASVILALIRQESAFNPQARSHVGARGLMQLMPTTAKQLHSTVHTKDLTNPDLNLRLGIKYLTGLAKKYEGNLIYTLAAYNAGPSRITRWMERVFISDNPLLMIESIPFKETRQYVKLIYRNIFFYKFLNNEIDLSIPTRDSFRIKVSSTR